MGAAIPGPAGVIAAPALELCFYVGMRLPPPWFVPVEAPACRAVLEVPAVGAETTDGSTALRFVCDRYAGHPNAHRQVTDNDCGHALEWAGDGSGPTATQEARPHSVAVDGQTVRRRRLTYHLTPISTEEARPQ